MPKLHTQKLSGKVGLQIRMAITAKRFGLLSLSECSASCKNPGPPKNNRVFFFQKNIVMLVLPGIKCCWHFSDVVLSLDTFEILARLTLGWLSQTVFFFVFLELQFREGLEEESGKITDSANGARKLFEL